LTAAFIGQQLKYGNGSSLFCEALIGKEGAGCLAWADITDKRICVTKSVKELQTLSSKHLLCVTGNLLDDIFMAKDAP